MNDLCPNCGTSLTTLNRSMILCRGCAREFEMERKAELQRRAEESAQRRYLPENGTRRVAGTVKEELENTLLRLDHNWGVTRESFLTFGQAPTLARTFLLIIVGGLVGWAGIRSLVRSTLPDMLALSMMAIGIVWPLYAIYKRIGFSRAQAAYTEEREEILAQIRRIEQASQPAAAGKATAGEAAAPTPAT